MKNTKQSILLTLLSGALFLISCGGDKAPPSAPSASAYPLTVCVVSGEELGSMGEPVVVEYEGTTVKLCCDSCLPKFNKEPGIYIAKLAK